MLEDSKVVGRIPVQDLQRARPFYAEKLDLQPSEERPGGLLYRCREGSSHSSSRSAPPLAIIPRWRERSKISRRD